ISGSVMYGSRDSTRAGAGGPGSPGRTFRTIGPDGRNHARQGTPAIDKWRDLAGRGVPDGKRESNGKAGTTGGLRGSLPLWASARVSSEEPRNAAVDPDRSTAARGSPRNRGGKSRPTL